MQFIKCNYRDALLAFYFSIIVQFIAVAKRERITKRNVLVEVEKHLG